MNVPNDPYMLLSFINTKLRDEFDNIDKFCEYYDKDKNEIEKKLENVGYRYNAEDNQFKNIG